MDLIKDKQLNSTVFTQSRVEVVKKFNTKFVEGSSIVFVLIEK